MEFQGIDFAFYSYFIVLCLVAPKIRKEKDVWAGSFLFEYII